MEDAGDDDGGPFVQRVAVLERIGLELSKRGDIAWIETDWFGGVGGSQARLWRDRGHQAEVTGRVGQRRTGELSQHGGLL